MSSPTLTIGMAHYDDFDGVWFTIQSLRTHHPESISEIELLVIDNSPESEHGKKVQNFVEGWVKPHHPHTKYIPAPEIVGTSAPRDRVFREASAPYVMCMDCHVLLVPNSLRQLFDYYRENPDTSDLLTGPMQYDNLEGLSTHFDDVWRAEMWGIWGMDDRGKDPDNPPFSIPAMGLGLFTCRKDAWLGFNPHFRGFGGEEFYIHEKFRKAGADCLCLPFLRWLHRFGRPSGVRYPLTRENKVRNYILGHTELGLDLSPVHEHFVQSGLFKQDRWDALVQECSRLNEGKPRISVKEPTKKPCGGCPGNDQPTSLEELFQRRVNDQQSDIHYHLPKLRELASQCSHVTEFGVRSANSTVALLAGQPETLHTYDISDCSSVLRSLSKYTGKTRLHFFQADTRQIDPIETTDLLFIDTLHTAEQLHAELEIHAPNVRRWIAFHDTITFGRTGEDGKPGIQTALQRHLHLHPEWSVVYHTNENNGLTVISRLSQDKPKLPSKFEMAKNLAKSLKDHVCDGLNTATEEQYGHRLAMCSLCEHRTDTRCTVCGCFIETKAKLRGSACPIGKWHSGHPLPPSII